MATLSVNGFEMYYEIHGEGSPLLVLHGFTGSGADLVPLFHPMTQKHQLIIPDLRGHGRSTNPSKQFTFRQAADDIFLLLKHLDIHQCSAVGFSGGGCLLLQLAIKHPALLSSMVLISATPYFPEQAKDLMQQFKMAKRTKEEWEGMRKIHLQGDEQIELIWQQAGSLSENDDDMNLTSSDLSKIKTKTLIMQGDRDPLYPVEVSIEMYRSMPNSSLWIVPNGGHVPLSGNTIQEFMNYLNHFL